MKELELLIIALEKGVKLEIYNKLEIASIQSALESLTKELTPKEDEDENKDIKAG